MGNQLCCDPTIQRQFRRGLPKKSQFIQSKWPQQDTFFQQFLKQSNQKVPTNGKVYKHYQKDKYYFGRWDDEIPIGTSIFYVPNQTLLIGQFINGKPNGQCQIKFLKENNQYKGFVKNGKAKGKGKYFNFNQKYYFDGEWQNSTPDNGTLTLQNDFNIDKIQFSDYKNGIGIIYYRDKRQYQGQINTRKLKPHNYGTVKFPQSNKKNHYKGQWNNGQIHGIGKLIWRDGSSYQGQYFNGQKDGLGRFTFPSKRYYQGYWVQGKQQGSGIFSNQHGTEIKRGIWKNGVFEKQLIEEDWKQEKIFDDQRLKNRRSAESSQLIRNSFKQDQKKQEQNRSGIQNNEREQEKGENVRQNRDENKRQIQQVQVKNNEDKKEDRDEEKNNRNDGQ